MRDSFTTENLRDEYVLALSFNNAVLVEYSTVVQLDEVRRDLMLLGMVLTVNTRRVAEIASVKKYLLLAPHSVDW